MLLNKKQRYKPFYKQFLKIRKNVQNRRKIFKFNKEKWKRFQLYSKKQLKFYKRFKLKDPFRLNVTKFTSKGNSFQKNFRNELNEKKTLSLFYGGLKKKYFKRKLNMINSSKKYKSSKFLNYKHFILELFESRLDKVLHSSKFSLSIKNARQLIKHGHILVNNLIVKTPSYILKTDDLIEVSSNVKSRNLVKKYIHQSNFWPIPPKHLMINYNTLQIIFLYKKNNNFFPNFTYQLKLNYIKFLQ
uniref:ribosomal protein S4 n=1 Tax=Nitzschia dissipata TaxID=303402 RepID=UPI0020293D76|nr:ribosomal protein S4 [Nitzschia dissipata]QYB23047.1 ribosomal protein S4 [Nitzschia dissipata]